MVTKALGLIETIGLTAAIEAADAAVKAGNVTLVGYEFARGMGLTTVKVLGDVGAVKAAVEAGAQAAAKVNVVYAKHVIPRPHKEISLMVEEVPIVKETHAVVSEEAIVEEPLPFELQKEDIIEFSEITKRPDEICNLCGDPLCPRKKGEPRVNCINYDKIYKEVDK